MTPGAVLPHAEELLDRQAVELAGVHAEEHFEDFSKSMKPCGLGKHGVGSDSTPRQGVIRHYMSSRIGAGQLSMNDKRHVSIDGMDSPVDLVGIKSAKVIKRLAMLRSKHSM